MTLTWQNDFSWHLMTIPWHSMTLHWHFITFMIIHHFSSLFNDFSSLFNDFSWQFMKLPWHFMTFYDISWLIMLSLDLLIISWHFLIYTDTWILVLISWISVSKNFCISFHQPQLLADTSNQQKRKIVIRTYSWKHIL